MKVLTNILQSLAIILCISLVSFAQTDSQIKTYQTSQADIKWTKIESPEQDWSFAVPEGYLVNNEGNENIIYFRSEGLSIIILTDTLTDTKKRLKLSFSFVSKKELNKYKFFEIKDFIGGYLKSEKEDSEYAGYIIRFASDTGLSSIYISDFNAENKIVQRFLESIRLRDKYLFTSTDAGIENEQVVNIASLNTDKSVLDAMRAEDSNQKNLIDSTDSKHKIEDKQIYSKPLLVVVQPRPSYTNYAREKAISGFTKLRISFLANGRIGDIKLVESLNKGLDKAAFKAARKIKFLPAEIDGKPVDVEKIVQYSFTVYLVRI